MRSEAALNGSIRRPFLGTVLFIKIHPLSYTELHTLHFQLRKFLCSVSIFPNFLTIAPKLSQLQNEACKKFQISFKKCVLMMSQNELSVTFRVEIDANTDFLSLPEFTEVNFG